MVDGVDISAALMRGQEATQALLGNTIAITDELWQMSSRLTGWTRAHIATHLARQADGLTGVLTQLGKNQPTNLYDAPDTIDDEIERGSERSALELQVDLDSSAGRLFEASAELHRLPPSRPVTLTPNLTVRLDELPLLRLNHLVLHHIDLNVGFTYRSILPGVAAWLLAYNAARIGRNSAYPAIRLASDSGVVALIGGGGRPQVVHGEDNLLLGWLTGRLTPDEMDPRLPMLPTR